MIDALPLLPLWVVDFVGAALMIMFSFFCVNYALQLRRTDRNNVIWTYLLWLSMALALFSVSRSVGHIAKRLLLLAGRGDIWVALRPFSGSINTLAFVIVASITLFFQRVYRINVKILSDKKAIEEVSKEVMRLNRNLEEIVRERTVELTKSEQKYRRIFEGSMDIILILDREGRFVDINEAGLETLGYASRPDLFSSTNFGELLLSPLSAQRLLEEISSAGFRKDLECQIRHRDGEILTWLFSFTVNRNADGEVVGYEGIAKDITRRKKMDKHLLQADRLASLGQLSAGVAHEINNPLGMILGYAQLLLRSEPKDTQRFQDLKIIEKHTRNCKTIVEDLLKFARSTDTQKGPVDVNELLREIIVVVEHQFLLDNVSIEARFDPPLPMLRADGEKLKQVFMNLIMNAKQAINGRGHIQVTTRHAPSEKQISISVVDTGSGIPAEIIDKIFDPFFTTKPTGQGTGLGLSVSYGIIKDHHGEITAQSTPGEGAMFTIILPLQPEEGEMHRSDET
jgi:two-component system NtrC family sensor kinase